MKKFILLLSVIFLSITIFSINKTFSYYVDSSKTNLDLNIAKWQIVINGEDVTLKEQHEFTIEELGTKNTSTQNSNGAFFPGMSGSYFIDIDTTNTQVAIKYVIEIDTSYIDNSNIKIKNIEADNGVLSCETSTCNGIINLEDVGKKSLIKIDLEWEENDDNDKDMLIGSLPDNTVSLPITVKFEQMVGE